MLPGCQDMKRYVTLRQQMKKFLASAQENVWVGFLLLLALTGIFVGIASLIRMIPLFSRSDSLSLLPVAEDTIWQLQIDPAASAPATTARAYWLYDRASGSLLAEKNSNTATSVASLAKLMTAYVSYDSYNLDQVVPVGSASAVLGNRAKFFAQDTYRVYDLLQALLIFSANDAAEALAQAHPNGREGFVLAMNASAQKLGLQNTSFENPTGLDSQKQYSSARDLGLLTHAILEFPAVKQVVNKQVVTIREQQTGRPTVVYSTNALLARDSRYQGVKTGTTDLAGQSLIVRFVDPVATSSATPNGTDLILVLLGSEQRFTDAQTLIEWVTETAQPVLRTLQ